MLTFWTAENGENRGKYGVQDGRATPGWYDGCFSAFRAGRTTRRGNLQKGGPQRVMCPDNGGPESPSVGTEVM
eukprot:1196041-Prorocentrum_minimum.AAC.8